MGKKYIVEIGRLERLYKASVNGNGKPNITWLSPEVDLTPYTEPDLEQVRKEAYQQGYEQGYKDGYNEPGKGKIQVGNEVKCIRAGWTAIVTKIKEDGYLTLMGNDGAIANGYDEKDFLKTGRNFPEIAEVLEKMRGEQDG